MMASSCSNSSSLNTTRLYFCDHCEKLLSKTLYYKHKKFYYDKNRKTWTKNIIHYEVDDFQFSGSDPESGELLLDRISLLCLDLFDYCVKYVEVIIFWMCSFIL